MTYVINNYFAQTYGGCAYSSSTYQNGSCSAGTSTGTSASTGSSGGLLTNTGFDIALAVTIACTIIFVALLVRFWKRPARKV